MEDDNLDVLDGEDQFEGGELPEGYKEIEIREQDRYLPIANIARIMKKVLPNNAKIAKESKESIQECVSEFISFITSEASDKCQQEKRKTINGDDLLWAMSTLGFDKYVDPLRIYLTKYRDSVKGDRPEKKATSRKDMASSAQPKSLAMRQAAYGFEDIPPGMGFLAEPGSAMMAPGKGGELPTLPMMRQSMPSLSHQGMYPHHLSPPLQLSPHPSHNLSHSQHSMNQPSSSSHSQIPSLYNSSPSSSEHLTGHLHHSTLLSHSTPSSVSTLDHNNGYTSMSSAHSKDNL